MPRNLQPKAELSGLASKGHIESSRWFRLWIASGLVLAVSLLVSSICTYTLVSRGFIVERLRGDLASQVSILDEQIRGNSVQSRSQVSAILQQTLDRNKGRIAWIQLQDGQGRAVSHAGSSAKSVFSIQDVRSHLQNRQPIFKTIDSPTGKLLVEVFPLLLPVSTIIPADFPVTGGSAGSLPYRFGTLEIAEAWEGAGATAWSFRRHLILNASAALMLLISLTVIALRLRSYVVGRQLEQEVEIARTVQLDLLPSLDCEFDSFEVAAEYVPLGRIGGDFYDTFAVRGDRPAFVLGDVCGKGIPAALLMGVLQGAVRASGWTGSPRDHQEATRQMNQLLCERTANMRFASMFWSYFDSQSQHLKYINAGHCPPLLVKAGHRNTIVDLSSGGPVLGLISGVEYQQGSVRLERGDVLVLYSDGIVEAANAAGEEFGEDRLQAIVRAHSPNSAEEIRNQILAALDAFTGSLMALDDRTLVVVVYLGTERRMRSREPQANMELSAHPVPVGSG